MIKNLPLPIIGTSLLLLTSCSESPSPKPEQSVGHPDLPVVNLDQPKSGSAISKSANNLAVSGWAVSPSGISAVAIYVDGRYMMDANLKLPRADVQALYPNVPNAGNAGWWANLSDSSFGTGAHDLLVEVKSGDGAVRDVESTVTVTP